MLAREWKILSEPPLGDPDLLADAEQTAQQVHDLAEAAGRRNGSSSAAWYVIGRAENSRRAPWPVNASAPPSSAPSPSAVVAICSAQGLEISAEGLYGGAETGTGRIALRFTSEGVQASLR